MDPKKIDDKQQLKPAKTVAAIIFAIFLLICIGAGLGYYRAVTFLFTPAAITGREVVLLVKPGQGLNRITADLAEKGLINNQTLFKLYARYKQAAGRLKAGEYRLSPQLTPVQILDLLLRGKVVRYRITIPEGLNMDEIAGRVAQAGFCKAETFSGLCRDIAFIKALNIPSHTLEGFLFPNTYFFPKGTTCREIIKKMVATFFNVYTSEWQVRTKKIGFTMQQIVTLASMIEKETGDASERPLISSVFHNRLKRKMRLECDPTVIYGDKDFKGRIRKRHLRRKTPYNTYQIFGLPKGPIANPGAKSIEAALYPDESDYLFFVSRNDTTHHFSKNLREHNRAVRKYQLNR